MKKFGFYYVLTWVVLSSGLRGEELHDFVFQSKSGKELSEEFIFQLSRYDQNSDLLACFSRAMEVFMNSFREKGYEIYSFKDPMPDELAARLNGMSYDQFISQALELEKTALRVKITDIEESIEMIEASPRFSKKDTDNFISRSRRIENLLFLKKSLLNELSKLEEKFPCSR